MLLTHQGLLKPTPNFFPDAAVAEVMEEKQEIWHLWHLCFLCPCQRLCGSAEISWCMQALGPRGAMGLKAAKFPLPYLYGWAAPASDSPLRCHVAEFGLGLSVTCYI